MNRINIGFINYANCLPVYYGFHEDYRDKYNLVGGTPVELNRLMKSGELIASNISSIEYARNPELYLIIPDICVSSPERVMSVNLYTRMEISGLDGKRISLTDASATSQALLKILLKNMFQFNNEYIEMPPDLDAMLDVSDAALVIGDEALALLDRKDVNIYDLGELWYKSTGLPFVFSLWVLDRKWAIDNPTQAYMIIGDFKKSLSGGLVNMDKIIEDCSIKLPGVDFGQYFKNMNYFFTGNYKKSLLLFYEMASVMGMTPKCDELAFCDCKKYKMARN